MPKLQLKKEYQKYPAYKDSGVEWIGKIPKDWSIASSRRLFASYKERVGSSFGDYKILSLTLHGVIPRVMDGSGKNPAEYDTYQAFKKDDLVFCLFDYDVTPRTIGYVEENGMMTGAYTRLVPKAETYSKYFYYYFLSLDHTKELLHLCTGLRNSLSKPIFWSMKSSLPPYNEQTKIANYLNEKATIIDQIIERKQKLIELLREKRTAVINNAVTKGLDPKVELVESGIEWVERIPKGWGVAPIKYNTEIQEGPGIMAEDFKEKGIPLLRIKNLKNGFVDLEGSNFLDPEKVNNKWNHFKLKKGDLLISGSASSGIVAEVTEEAVGAIAYTGLIRIVSKNIYRQFLKSLLDSKYFNEQVEIQKAGTAMQHYGPTHLKKVVIVVPSKDEQIKIAEYLDKRITYFGEFIKGIEKSIELLSEFKSSLIFNVVTGKARV